MAFLSEKANRSLRMLLKQQGVFFEKKVPRRKRFTCDGSLMRRVVDHHIMREGNGSILQGPPSKIGILSEMGIVKALIESSHGVERA